MCTLAEVTVGVPRGAVEYALGLGSMLAVVSSWHRNRSISLALLAGILSWLYVAYYVLTREEEATIEPLSPEQREAVEDGVIPIPRRQ